MLEPLIRPSAARQPLASPDLHARGAGMHSFEDEVGAMREAMFALTDSARRMIPSELTQVHVRLQAIANELGEVERTLRSAELERMTGLRAVR